MMLVAFALFVLMHIAVYRSDRLDVATGRRDGNDGYGSNRGWYWPWTPIIQVCFVGILLCILGAL